MYTKEFGIQSRGKFWTLQWNRKILRIGTHIKNGNVVGHLPKGKYGRFSKTIFFLRADEYGSCKVRINKSKAINRGDGMEKECTLEFLGQRRFIDILKGNLKD